MIERSNPAGMHTPPGYSHVTVATGERTVHLVLPESDYVVDYHFRNDGCWRLYRMVDHSM